MSVKEQSWKRNPSGTGTSDQQALGRKEMVKQMFYENCRSSASGHNHYNIMCFVLFCS